METQNSGSLSGPRMVSLEGNLSERVRHSWEGGNVKEGGRELSKKRKSGRKRGEKKYRGNS